jgi:hypothetical protein
MRKQDVPQDWGPEAEVRRLMYAVDESGRFVGVQSVGWDVSNTGFNKYWEHVGQIIAAARADVAEGRKSPLWYWMQVSLLDVRMLADYMGLWRWRVRRHMRPGVFAKLKPALLDRYAAVFQIEPAQVRSLPEEDPENLPIHHAPGQGQGA